MYSQCKSDISFNFLLHHTKAKHILHMCRHITRTVCMHCCLMLEMSCVGYSLQTQCLMSKYYLNVDLNSWHFPDNNLGVKGYGF